jgi:hypothetical protein
LLDLVTTDSSMEVGSITDVDRENFFYLNRREHILAALHNPKFGLVHRQLFDEFREILHPVFTTGPR